MLWFHNAQLHAELPVEVINYLSAVEATGLQVNESKIRPIGQPNTIVKLQQIMELTKVAGVIDSVLTEF